MGSCDGAKDLRDDDHDSDGCRRWVWWIGGLAEWKLAAWGLEGLQVNSSTRDRDGSASDAWEVHLYVFHVSRRLWEVLLYVFHIPRHLV